MSETKSKDTFEGALGRFICSLAVGVFNAFVFRWGWMHLLRPLGLPAISFAEAYGLFILVRFATFVLPRNPPTLTPDEEWTRLRWNVLWGLLAWALMAIAWGQT